MKESHFLIMSRKLNLEFNSLIRNWEKIPKETNLEKVKEIVQVKAARKKNKILSSK